MRNEYRDHEHYRRRDPEDERDAAMAMAWHNNLDPAEPARSMRFGYVDTYPGTSRNAPCPCGSSKKYKRCCNRMVVVQENAMVQRLLEKI